MNKILIPFLTLGLAVLTASCSDSDEPAAGGNNAPANTVEITCQVPTGTIHSRGADANGFYGDGSEATHLVYAVYNADGQKVLSSDDATAPVPSFANGKFTVYLPNTYTSDYSIFFWADAWDNDAGTPFTFDWAAKTVTVDYSKSLLMGEKADAFYCYSKLSSNSYTLTRPFEQIAVATFMSEKNSIGEVNYGEIFFEIVDADMGEYLFGDDQSHDKFMPTGFNFETGDIILSDTDGWIPFKVSTGNFTLDDGKEYTHLFVGYFFAPANNDKTYQNGYNSERLINFYFSNDEAVSRWEKDFTVMPYTTGPNTRTLIIPKANTPGLLTHTGEYNIVVNPEMGTSTVTK